jgi:hypothetical protein
LDNKYYIAVFGNPNKQNKGQRIGVGTALSAAVIGASLLKGKVKEPFKKGKQYIRKQAANIGKPRYKIDTKNVKVKNKIPKDKKLPTSKRINTPKPKVKVKPINVTPQQTQQRVQVNQFPPQETVLAKGTPLPTGQTGTIRGPRQIIRPQKLKPNVTEEGNKQVQKQLRKIAKKEIPKYTEKKVKYVRPAREGERITKEQHKKAVEMSPPKLRETLGYLYNNSPLKKTGNNLASWTVKPAYKWVRKNPWWAVGATGAGLAPSLFKEGGKLNSTDRHFRGILLK